MPSSESRLPLLDYCRFAAAVSVLCFHYFWNGIANGKIASFGHVDALTVWARHGRLGVDLFFMISGYVIFTSARRRTASQFVVGRAIRLYPAYLVAMLTTACFAHWLGTPGTHITLKQALGNVLLYQPWHRQPFVDGVYWTLMIEIKFYAAVTLALVLGAQRHLATLFKLWPAAMLVALAIGRGSLLDPLRADWPMLGGFYAYFASGALFAILRTAPSATTWAALAASTLVGLRYELALCGARASKADVAVTIGAILAFTLMFVAINRSAGRLASLPGSQALGALTYPLYLIHAHIGYMLLSHLGAWNPWLAYGVTIGFVLGLAALIHHLVEVRLAGFWRSFFEEIMSTGAGIALRARHLLRPGVRPVG